MMDSDPMKGAGMKRLLMILLQVLFFCNVLFAANNVPADNSYIQYFGRWDFSNPTAPTHSWPGVYVYAEFEGTSIGVMTDDNFSYYNVFIDDSLYLIFHGTTSGVSSYTLASGLTDTTHKILFALRSELNWTKFAFNGFILDDGKNLLPPPIKPQRKIEFIGDSYTVASGNEWTGEGSAPNDSYTNIYKSFGPMIARNYNAQYQISARGGFGLVLDYLGNYDNNLPNVFDRALVYTSTPKWDYLNFVPNLVVVCLGLNDYNGWGGYSGPIDSANAVLYRDRYHGFISTIMGVYPHVKILTVAPNGIQWLKDNISQVVTEENSSGHTNVFYASFPYYTGGYVHNGHPTVETHQKIADTLIAIIDSINAWETYPPGIVKMPSSPFTVYDTSYVLEVQTDSYDTLRYSAVDKPYSEMDSIFTTTGTWSHSVTLSSLQHGHEYTYYIRGMDLYGNVMDTSAVINFLVDTTKHIVNWTSLSYDDSQWHNGPTPISNVNDTSTATLIDTVTTAYFRKKVTIDSIENISSITLWVKGHDGAIFYANEEEVLRVNLPTGVEIGYSTYTLDSSVFTKRTVSSFITKLHNGENIIAIEVHTMSGQNRHLSFDSKFVDGNGKTYYPYGSAWNYYDEGNMPGDQVQDKPTEVALRTEGLLPDKMTLYPNYPNPFNPLTTIRYVLPAKSRVSMKIFDLLGREIVTLVDEEKPEGMYSVQFNAGNLSSGMYFCRLQAGYSVAVRKLMLVK
jgi:hypothetical protein